MKIPIVVAIVLVVVSVVQADDDCKYYPKLDETWCKCDYDYYGKCTEKKGVIWCEDKCPNKPDNKVGWCSGKRSDLVCKGDEAYKVKVENTDKCGKTNKWDSSWIKDWYRMKNDDDLCKDECKTRIDWYNKKCWKTKWCYKNGEWKKVWWDPIDKKYCGKDDGGTSSSCKSKKNKCKNRAKKCRSKCDYDCLKDQARSKCRKYLDCEDKDKDDWYKYAHDVCD